MLFIHIIHIVTIFVASCETGGAKPKSGGAVAPLLQRRTATGNCKLMMLKRVGCQNTADVCTVHVRYSQSVGRHASHGCR